MSRVTYKPMGTLRFALLSLLEQGPRSGYDLAQTLDLRVSPFWHAKHSQIYPELAALEHDALIEHEVLEQDDRPDKKLYTIRAAGHRALVEWLTSPIEPEAKRDELVLRALAIGHADRSEAVALYRSEAQRHREREARYRRVLAQLSDTYAATLDDPTSPAFGHVLTLQRGIGYEREYAAWCKSVADTLERIAGASDVPVREAGRARRARLASRRRARAKSRRACPSRARARCRSATRARRRCAAGG